MTQLTFPGFGDTLPVRGKTMFPSPMTLTCGCTHENGQWFHCADHPSWCRTPDCDVPVEKGLLNCEEHYGQYCLRCGAEPVAEWCGTCFACLPED